MNLSPSIRVPSALATLVACSALAFAAGTGDSSAQNGHAVPFDELANSFRDAHVPKGASAEDGGLDAILKRDYARAEIGVFELCYPTSFLKDKTRAENFRDIATGVCDLQSKWIDIVANPGDKATDGKTKLAVVRAWIQSWKPGALASLDKESNKDLFELLKADASVVEANQAARELLFSPADMSLVPIEKKDSRLVFAPTRRDFIEFDAFSGLIDEQAKKMNWLESAPEWTQFWVGSTIVIALEYSPWGGVDPQFKTSLPMSKIGPTVMIQHVVQQATLSLLWHCAPAVPQGHFDFAMAIDMAIAVCGESNTIENAGSVYANGASTAPYEQFIPGGNPKGGTLPPHKAQGSIAENGWRKGHGKDHFAESLRAGQKSGAKEVKGPTKKDPLANFTLKGEDDTKFVVHAPFFGPDAAAQEYPPPQYLIDYAEFFRAYKAAFLYWLETHGDPASPEASAAKFRELLTALGKRTAGQTFDQVVSATYPTPISGPDGSKDSLEWRFLKWIQSGK